MSFTPAALGLLSRQESKVAISHIWNAQLFQILQAFVFQGQGKIFHDQFNGPQRVNLCQRKGGIYPN